MVEEWRDVVDAPGYKVSNRGRVWSDKRNKILKENRLSSTYTYVALYIDDIRTQVRVCELVAIAFLDYNSRLDDFVHIDRNRRNNDASNILVIKNRNYLNYIDRLVELKDGEEFLPMYDYDDVYISNYGRVYSGRIFDFMKINATDGGYLTIDIERKGRRNIYLVHRAVADHFIEKEEDRDCVNHIDLDKWNPHYTNLEWVSRSENTQHAYENKTDMRKSRKTMKDKDCLLESGELIAPCCVGNAGAYMVTSFGRVYSNERKMWLRQSIHGGYCRVRLANGERKVSVAVHRLVAHAFVAPNHFTGLLVNHIDANRLNNIVDNLEWVTNSENNKKKFHETGANVTGNRRTAMTDADLEEIRRLYATGEYTYWQLGEMYNVKVQTISNVVNRLTCYKNR